MTTVDDALLDPEVWDLPPRLSHEEAWWELAADVPGRRVGPSGQDAGED